MLSQLSPPPRRGTENERQMKSLPCYQSLLQSQSHSIRYAHLHDQRKAVPSGNAPIPVAKSNPPSVAVPGPRAAPKQAVKTAAPVAKPLPAAPAKQQAGKGDDRVVPKATGGGRGRGTAAPARRAAVPVQPVQYAAVEQRPAAPGQDYSDDSEEDEAAEAAKAVRRATREARHSKRIDDMAEAIRRAGLLQSQLPTFPSRPQYTDNGSSQPMMPSLFPEVYTEGTSFSLPQQHPLHQRYVIR